MRKFKDALGRDWELTINVTAIRRVRDLAKVDLHGVLDDPKIILNLSVDSLALADVLWALCEGQAKAANITFDQFGEGLAGDAIAVATDAFMEELADFFPSGRRLLLRAAIGKRTELEAEAVMQGTERLEKIEPKTAIQNAMAQRSSAISGSLPASPA